MQLFARHNLLLLLCDMDRIEEAQQLLEEARPQYLLYPAAGVQLRLRWAEGRIALRAGDLDEAEKALVATREGFEKQGASYEAALSSLDLAMVYATEHRISELKQLAEEMFATFQSHDIHREAYAAILVFHQAAQMETVTLKMLRGVIQRVERSQHLPPDPPS